MDFFAGPVARIESRYNGLLAISLQSRIQSHSRMKFSRKFVPVDSFPGKFDVMESIFFTNLLNCVFVLTILLFLWFVRNSVSSMSGASWSSGVKKRKAIDLSTKVEIIEKILAGS